MLDSLVMINICRSVRPSDSDLQCERDAPVPLEKNLSSQVSEQ